MECLDRQKAHRKGTPLLDYPQTNYTVRGGTGDGAFIN
nr:MAG TPA: hypothetical protein [Caudoviricetes sp.]